MQKLHYRGSSIVGKSVQDSTDKKVSEKYSKEAVLQNSPQTACLTTPPAFKVFVHPFSISYANFDSTEQKEDFSAHTAEKLAQQD